MRNEIKKEMDASYFAKAQLFINTIENDLENSMILQGRIIQKNSIKILSEKATNLDIERIRLLLEVKEDITQLVEGSQYVEEAIVYVGPLRKSISNKTISNITEEDYDLLIDRFIRYRRYPFLLVNGEYYCVLTPYYLIGQTENLNPSIIFLLRINRKMIEEELDKYFEIVDGGAFFTSNAENAGIDLFNDNDMPVYHALMESNKYQPITSSQTTVKINNRTLTVRAYESSVLNTILCTYQPKDTLLASLKPYRWYLISVLFILFLSVFLFSIKVKQMVITPLNKLMKAFSGLDKDNTKVKVEYDKNDEFNYVYAQFNDMLAKLKQLIKQVYEEKLYSNNAELKQLQYQIAPHFLYNCLFIINRLAKMKNMEAVIKFSQHLGNYYQFITRSGEQEITLSAEFAHLYEYIGIQSMRFGKRITVDQDEQLEIFKTVLVPRLILQPIVENAYNYGLKNKIHSGIIRLKNDCINDVITIRIEDNGDELTDDKLSELNQKMNNLRKISETTGILNIHRRMQIQFGDQYGIQVSRSELGGMCVVMMIPVNNLTDVEKRD
jgi:two-component system sensor histidine kinase YesM